MKINLFTINPDGEEFSVDQTNTEVSEELSDLLKGSDFQCSFRLTPLGDAVEIKGEFTAKLPLDCSFCSEDYAYPIQFDYSDYLVADEKTRIRKSKPGQEIIADGEAGNTEENVGVEAENFVLALYLRDKIGFSIPFQVPCATELDKCEKYAYSQKAMMRHKAPELEETNPFSALKDLDIDKKR